jgi:hypothetical protein
MLNPIVIVMGFTQISTRSYVTDDLTVSLSLCQSSSDIKYSFVTGRLSTSNNSRVFETQIKLGDTG